MGNTLEIKKERISLYKAVEMTGGLDIYDVDWDWATYFSCNDSWEKCQDSYEKLMLLFALNIECVTVRKEWYSQCDVKGFIVKNMEVFKKFFNEENTEGYRPMDYENADDYDKDDGFYEAYMLGMESLIIGNYAEKDYEKLYKALGGK